MRIENKNQWGWFEKKKISISASEEDNCLWENTIRDGSNLRKHENDKMELKGDGLKN